MSGGNRFTPAQKEAMIKRYPDGVGSQYGNTGKNKDRPRDIRVPGNEVPTRDPSPVKDPPTRNRRIPELPIKRSQGKMDFSRAARRRLEGGM